MRCTLLTENTAADWAGCIPQKLFRELYQQKSGLHALGISAFGEPQGAAVWEEADGAVSLESVYVRPHARQLGLGGELLGHVLARTAANGGNKITVSYAEQGERCLLTPFLSRCGFFMERTVFPMGEVTLRELTEKLLPQLGAGREGVCPLCELSLRDRKACAVWLEERIAMPLAPYLTDDPVSFAAVREGEVQGAVFLSGAGTEISLDYCGILPKHPTVLARLLACAIERLTADRDLETVVRMVLSTPQAMTLFERLFGQPEGEAFFCSGAYRS